jgi:LacI family transcriptional regulator
LIIAQTDENFDNEKEVLRMFLSYRVDGIIACLSLNTVDTSHFKNLLSRKIPFVLFDRVHYNLDCTKVVVDNFEGAYKAATHLINVGCRRPAHLGGTLGSKIFKERANGFREALQAANIPLPPEYMLSTDLTARDIHEAMSKWMNLPEPPDGILTASGSSGLILSSVARDVYQLQIPDDLAIITFGSEPCHEFVTPSISSIDMPGFNMGCTAAGHLFQEIIQKSSVKKIILEPLQLIIRNSTLRSGN